MKVILLQNVAKLGKKFEVKNVADGFARNFLIEKKLAISANEKNMQWLEREKENKSFQAEQELEKTGEMVAKLEGQEIEMPLKVGDKGQLFEKLNGKKIAAALSQKGFPLSEEQIVLKEPIKEPGEFEIKIKFEHGLEANIKLIINKS